MDIAGRWSRRSAVARAALVTAVAAPGIVLVLTLPGRDPAPAPAANPAMARWLCEQEIIDQLAGAADVGSASLDTITEDSTGEQTTYRLTGEVGIGDYDRVGYECTAVGNAYRLRVVDLQLTSQR